MKRWTIISCWIFIVACSSAAEKTNAASDESPRTVEQVVDFYPNGVKKVEGKLVNGEKHGRWVFYYDNGFMWSEGMFKYGKREGYSVVYYKDGRKRMKGQYENDQKVGAWSFWNEEGEFIESIDADKLRNRIDSLVK